MRISPQFKTSKNERVGQGDQTCRWDRTTGHHLFSVPLKSGRLLSLALGWELRVCKTRPRAAVRGALPNIERQREQGRPGSCPPGSGLGSQTQNPLSSEPAASQPPLPARSQEAGTPDMRARMRTLTPQTSPVPSGTTDTPQVPKDLPRSSTGMAITCHHHGGQRFPSHRKTPRAARELSAAHGGRASAAPVRP